MNLLNEEQYREIVSGAEGQALDGVWAYFEVPGPPFGDQPAIETFGFEKCKEFFFEIISRLLLEKRIKLAKNGVLLEQDPDELIRLFKIQFPTSLASVSETGGVGTWFFTEGCPAGAVWIFRTETGAERLEWT